MKYIALSAVVASAIPAISALVINTPSGLVPCQPILLTYGSGVAPYYLTILPGGQVSGAPIHTWDPTNAESMTWIVDLPSGTAVTLSVKDSTGAQAYSDQVNVQPGGDSSCLNSASSSNAAAASSAASNRPSASSAAGSSSHAATTSAAASASGNHPATQSASSNAVNGNSSASDARRITSGVYGVAAAAGLLGALLV